MRFGWEIDVGTSWVVVERGGGSRYIVGEEAGRGGSVGFCLVQIRIRGGWGALVQVPIRWW